MEISRVFGLVLSDSCTRLTRWPATPTCELTAGQSRDYGADSPTTNQTCSIDQALSKMSAAGGKDGKQPLRIVSLLSGVT